jgi:hypothetical protein
MSCDPYIVAGYDTDFTIEVTKDHLPVDLTGATISASIVDVNRFSTVVANVAQSSLTTGANWPLGIVVASFSATETATVVSDGRYQIMLHITQGGRTFTYVSPIILGDIVPT